MMYLRHLISLLTLVKQERKLLRLYPLSLLLICSLSLHLTAWLINSFVQGKSSQHEELKKEMSSIYRLPVLSDKSRMWKYLDSYVAFVAQAVPSVSQAHPLPNLCFSRSGAAPDPLSSRHWSLF